MSKRQTQSVPQFDGDADLDGLIEQDTRPNLFQHLTEDFRDLMSNKQVLRSCIEKFVDNLVDEFTLGVVFDLHRKFKTNAYCSEIQDSEDEDESKVEVLQQASVKNYQKFSCPNCDRTVAPLGFARHLSKCMGIRDISRSSRIASRRAVTNKDKGDSSVLGGVPSDDDDDDEDWNSRRNNKKKDKNGSKKSRGTPKKGIDHEPSDAVNVDIEGSYDEVTNLRYMMDQGRRSYVMDLQERRSSSTSPTEGASTTPKKRDKNKKRTKAKDRGSPSTSLTFD